MSIPNNALLKIEMFLRPDCELSQEELSLGIICSQLREGGKLLGFRVHYSVFSLATGDLVTTFVAEAPGDLEARKHAEYKFQYWMLDREAPKASERELVRMKARNEAQELVDYYVANEIGKFTDVASRKLNVEITTEAYNDPGVFNGHVAHCRLYDALTKELYHGFSDYSELESDAILEVFANLQNWLG